jgi:glycogen phosphorylase
MTKVKEIIPNEFHLPERINRLGELAYNLWWVWNPEAQRIFSWIRPTLWERVNHNPVKLLKQVSPECLQSAAENEDYLQVYDKWLTAFDAYMANGDTWCAQECSEVDKGQIAYFSFEFGLHESCPVYAGGLGILSGDHLKEASDLGLPLVGVGFIYQQGYFTQNITEDGWQETRNYFLNFEEMPIIPLLDADDKPVKISVMLSDRAVWARLWKIQVGRISLYLLDSNLEENTQSDRQLTARLYSNDLEVRISQEILLGIGGVRALRRLGLHPTVWHMNEGHSAFLGLERVREYITQNGVDFAKAAEEVRKTSVFTTHTPVPAGNDQFPVWLVEKFFYNYWPQLGLSRDEFVQLASHAQPWGETFSMPVLALRLSEYANGVSKLHGQVSRKMWQFLWPEKEESEVPISHVTNGVHNGSWLARRTGDLFEQYLGADWADHLDDAAMWDKVLDIPDEELWAVKRHLKRKLVMFANRRVRRQWLSNTVHPVQVIAGGAMLEPYSLTIGFARRFATYKRGYLIFRDFDRLLRLINDEDRPVQIVFAGKAHPADEPGKMLIQQVYRAVKDARTGGRLVFMDDYDMNVARYLVQGVDVWLNTPRRPNEASGTSGMKAALNGTLNFSILDGWWYEGFNGKNGWAIGDGSEYADHNQQDDADAASLYDTLENQIIPLYYSGRSGDAMSHEWVRMVKESIRTLSPQFSMSRMVKEYTRNFYLPAAGKKK